MRSVRTVVDEAEEDRLLQEIRRIRPHISRAGPSPDMRGERVAYAVLCRAQKERLAVRALLAKGIDVHWPHYLAEIRHGTRRGYAFRSWYPRYLFVFEGASFSPREVNSAMAVSSLVYVGDNLLEIPPDVMWEIRSMSDPSGLIPASKLGPKNMVKVRGDNFLQCLLVLGGLKARMWAKGMTAAVRAA